MRHAREDYPLWQIHVMIIAISIISMEFFSAECKQFGKRASPADVTALRFEKEGGWGECIAKHETSGQGRATNFRYKWYWSSDIYVDHYFSLA